jgi:hypothetical protein
LGASQELAIIFLDRLITCSLLLHIQSINHWISSLCLNACLLFHHVPLGRCGSLTQQLPSSINTNLTL